MKLLNVNIGKPQAISWLGRNYDSSIYKSSVKGPQRVNFLGLDGDTQSDTRVHGGVNKAVYSYDEEFYEHWKDQIDWNDWMPGLFGENLTTRGLTDKKVKIGNVYKIGTAKLQPTEPRFPCSTLNAVFGRKDMVEKFVEQNRFGTYYRVVEEGVIQEGDAIELIEESKDHITISDITHAKFSKGEDQIKLKEILESQYVTDLIKGSLKMYLK